MKRAALAAIVAIAASAVLVTMVSAKAASGSNACHATPGGHVTLASEAVDPDVFLWDSRDRLIEYEAGQWGNARAIFAHTVLAEPGTRAWVVSCYPSVAHPQHSADGDEDAIGVKIMSGPYRGRYGWVLSSDTHPLDATPTAIESPAP